MTSWAALVHKSRSSRIPACGDVDCSSTRRLWRRLRWRHAAIQLHGSVYCAPACFESATREKLALLCARTHSFPPLRHRIPLGLLLIARGQLTNHQLRLALEAQRTGGTRRLGEWLEHLGFVTEQQVTAALAQQWACPVLAANAPLDAASFRLLPIHLLESCAILPVQLIPQTRVFHLAFSEGIDYGALNAIEEMFECRTQACIVPRSMLLKVLQLARHERRPQDFFFGGWHEAADMARITCGYVLKLGADAVRLVRFGSFIWARLSRGTDVANLVFERATETSQATHEDHTISFPATG